ncbi:MAG: hypothetical protein JWO94_3386, partial [Verrucomicrobiaceae bacterium]|nr:hypothetical protein [Verrucomicrobiaceae bacterium]
ETVYLETTIPSFLAAKASSQPIIARRQTITHAWWHNEKARYKLYSSIFVRNEALRGDPEAAARRLTFLRDIPELVTPAATQPLANGLIKLLQLPLKAVVDASHLALAILHKIDYLLTWNCTHLANPTLQRRLIEYCEHYHLHVPVICTPEYLTPNLL